jgi:hypothetical protein
MLTTALGVASALSSLLAPLFQGSPTTQNINPYTEEMMTTLRAALAEAQARQSGYANQAEDAAQRVGERGEQVGRVADQIADVDKPSANAWFDQWLGNIPEYEQIAQNFAQKSTDQLGNNLNRQAELQTQQALEQVSQQFQGQGFSGAAMQAAGQGAAAPIAAAQSQLAGQQANIAQGIFNQLSGQGQSLAQQGQQNEFQNAIQALTQQMAGYSTAGQNSAQQGQTYSSLAGQQGSQIQQLLGSLAGMGDPLMQTQQPRNLMSDIALGTTTAFNLFADPNNAFLNNLFAGKDAPTPAPDFNKFQGGANTNPYAASTPKPTAPPASNTVSPGWTVPNYGNYMVDTRPYTPQPTNPDESMSYEDWLALYGNVPYMPK